MEPSSNQKILVVIANHGIGNDRYLCQLIREYRSMPYSIDIVVTSNVSKQLGSDIELVVGLPMANPRSLPFAHKQIFADRLEQYDLFIYSEDDTLITKGNIEAFLAVTPVLPDGEVPGFLRIEKDAQGSTHFPDVHHRFHWDSQSVTARGGYTFAFFTNEHAACYLLTRGQLQRAIRSGGFLVGPHEGKYGMLETAATDPYTQCGLKKVICISELDHFLVHHLPDKYIEKLGLAQCEFQRQIEALIKIGGSREAYSELFEVQAKFDGADYSKDYYEQVRFEVLSLLPSETRNVLSIGCGWGKTEQELVNQGKRVMAVPLDPVISACAIARGIDVVHSDLGSLQQKLRGETFDCLLMSNVLHLIPNPMEFLSSISPLLSDNSVVIALVPNLGSMPMFWRRISGKPAYRNLRAYEETGVQITSRGTVNKWFTQSGLRVGKILNIVPPRAQAASQATFGLFDSYLASEFAIVAQRASS